MNWIETAADWGWQAFVGLLTGAISWFLYIERKINQVRGEHENYKTYVADNYVKKTDIDTLKSDIQADFKDVKDSQAQILDLLLSQKIGTNARRK